MPGARAERMLHGRRSGNPGGRTFFLSANAKQIEQRVFHTRPSAM